MLAKNIGSDSEIQLPNERKLTEKSNSKLD